MAVIGTAPVVMARIVVALLLLLPEGACSPILLAEGQRRAQCEPPFLQVRR